MRNLVHDALLSVTVRVLHGVELVQQRRLLSGAARGGGGALGGTTSGSTVVVVVVTSGRSIGHGGGSGGARSANGLALADSGADGAGLAGKGVRALLATAQGAALTGELVHGHGGEGGDLVVLGLVVVDFVHGDGGVHDGGLDRLLLDDGLDGLVNMVVNVLAGNGGRRNLGVRNLSHLTGVLELRRLGRDALLHVLRVAVLVLAVLDGSHGVRVLLGEDLLVLDGLDGGVEVVLVDLAVDNLLGLLLLLSVDALLLDGGVDALVDGGVMLAILGEEAGNRCLRLVHFDDC